MRRKIFVLGAALLFGLGASACAATPESGMQADHTTIEVENNNSLLVSVEALSDGIDYELGQVEARRPCTSVTRSSTRRATGSGSRSSRT